MCREKHSVLLLATFVVSVTAHGSMINPIPRNAVDRNLSMFANGSWPKGDDGCNCADPKGGCVPAAARPAMGGQPCLWFSQGCSIGCKECNGDGSHTAKSLCDNPTITATVNDPMQRTINRDVVAGSVNDTTRFNPWRAPGFAPVYDACGMAGGTDISGTGGAAVFAPTWTAKLGDKGTQVLKPGPAAAHWHTGESVEVSWGIRYNHGGGYQYRLCPADSPLTEKCFQQTPLEFVRDKHALQFSNGSRYSIPGTWVDKGTSPAGSTWAMNPIPRIDPGPWPTSKYKCKHFPELDCMHIPSPCPERTCTDKSDPSCVKGMPWHKIDPHSRTGDVEGECSGNWVDGQIIDEVRIPTDLPPGKYVVGFRWDCEETSQVWASCADVLITASN